MGGMLAQYGGVNDPYGSFTAGRTGTQAGLPREWIDFLSGAFGPLEPLVPAQLDEPGDTGRAMPRRWQYPVGWNLPVGIPGSEGLKLASFQALRRYPDMYSVLRACLDVRKEEMLGLAWDIGPTEEAMKQLRGQKSALSALADDIAEAKAFFSNPDPNYAGYQGWFSAALEDIFVTDNLSIYLHPTRKSGKGPFGSDLAALDLISGDTIRPVIDIRGGRPRPPAPAYQQYLWGIPRGDLMDVIMGRDLEDLDEPTEEYAADQLLYLPYTTRTWTPYGFSTVEKCIVPVAIGMKRQEWLLDFFTEGSIPGVYIVPGPEVATPTQQRLLQDSLNALAGDIAYKHRVIVLPPGSKPEWQKDIKLAGDQTDQMIAEQVMMVCRVQPQEIAMLPGGKSASIGAKGAAEMAQQSTIATRTDPMRMWLKRSLFDYVLQRMWGRTQLEWKWPGFDNTEDAETQSSIDKTYVSVGIRTVDEVRSDHGWEPYGQADDDGMTSEPFVLTANGPVTLTHAATMEQQSETAGEQSLMAAHQTMVQSEQGAQQSAEEHDRAMVEGQQHMALAANEEQRSQESHGHQMASDQQRMALNATGEERAQEAHETAQAAPAPQPAQKAARKAVDAAEVYEALARVYPASVLGWVKQATWHLDPAVPLSDIDLARRPGGRNPAKVNGIAAAIRDGQVMAPVVLVQTSDPKLQIADGYHRTLAYEHEERPTIAAYVGSGVGDDGPWDREMHEAKLNKAAAELADLRKFVKHGRDPAGFRPILLSEADVMAVAANVGRYGPAEAFRLARAQLTKADPTTVRSDAKRDHSITPIVVKTAATLGVLASQLRRGKIAQPAFVDQASASLQDGYGDAYDAGFGDSGGDGSLDDEAYKADVTQKAADKQREFLIGLAAAVAAGSVSEAALSSRLDMYAQSVYPTYEAGFGSGIASRGQVQSIIWHAEGDKNTCEPCASRAEKVYTPQTLPGYPGELGICDGGPHCRCFLEYTYAPAQEAA